MAAFALSSPLLGSIAPGSTTYQTVYTPGKIAATGSLTATDPRTKVTGTLPISVVTQVPPGAGGKYSYSGSLTQSFVESFPAPVPSSVSGTTTYQVAQTLTVSPTASPGVYDYHLVETDTQPLQTTQTTSDSYYAFPSGAGNVTLLSTVSTNGTATVPGYVITQSPGAGNGLFDILPETAGASWTNQATLSYKEVDADGTTEVRNVAANGTYVDTTTYPSGSALGPVPGSTLPPYVATITQNADGSGSYSIPYAVYHYGGNRLYAFGAPTPNPSGTPYIPITITQATGAVSTSTATVWYPTPVVLYSETDKTGSLTSIPSACNVPSSYGSTALPITQTITHTDTIVGYIDVQTTTRYSLPGFGVACVVLNDVNSAYYNENQGTVNVIYAYPTTPTPLQVTTTTETVGLVSSSLMSSARSPQSLSPVIVQSIQASFQRQVDAVIRSRRTAAIKALMSTGGR